MRRKLPLFASAWDILADLDLQSPPVDPSQVAEAYGFRVALATALWHGGVSLEERVIYVNSAADRHLQRFIVAHEFGHAVLHGHLKSQFFDTFSAEVIDPVNAQAAEFALELLMPRNWIVARIGELSTASLAELFDVPVGALRARIKSLGL